MADDEKARAEHRLELLIQLAQALKVEPSPAIRARTPHSYNG